MREAQVIRQYRERPAERQASLQPFPLRHHDRLPTPGPWQLFPPLVPLGPPADDLALMLCQLVPGEGPCAIRFLGPPLSVSRPDGAAATKCLGSSVVR